MFLIWFTRFPSPQVRQCRGIKLHGNVTNSMIPFIYAGVGVDPVINNDYVLRLRSGTDTVTVGGLTSRNVALNLITSQTPAFNIDPFSGIQGRRLCNFTFDVSILLTAFRTKEWGQEHKDSSLALLIKVCRVSIVHCHSFFFQPRVRELTQLTPRIDPIFQRCSECSSRPTLSEMQNSPLEVSTILNLMVRSFFTI
jgi:hypothetical protein